MNIKTFYYGLLVYVLCGVYCLSTTYYYKQFALLPFIIPALYYVITLVVSLLLVRKFQTRLHVSLLLFLLAVALAYISFVPAQLYDSFAFLLYHTASLASVSFLIHFLKYYFSMLGVTWPYISSLMFYYSFPVLAFICSLGALLVPSVTSIVEWITILLFMNGLFNILAVLLIGYKRSHAVQLKWLIGVCILPFSPFVIGYIIPTLFKAAPIIPAEIAALFFSAIPIGFIVFQIGERLFATNRYVSRLRYFTFLSFVNSSVLAIFLYAFTQQLTMSILLLIGSFIATIAILSIKDRFDLQYRKQNKQHYHEQQIFHLLKDIPSKEKLLYELPFFIKKYLQIDDVSIVAINTALHEITYHQGVYTIGFWHGLTLQIGHEKQVVYLLPKEISFLEMLSYYVFTLLEQFEELSTNQQDATVYKIAWQLVEREKKELAQQLHDTILQEQIILARQLEDHTIREQLLDINFELREFCETLHPPLLEAIGLEAAIQKLIQKVNLRADFHATFTSQLTGVIDDALALMIYRTIQELLSNAMKHAEASKVTMNVTVFEGFYTLTYEDDGIGFTETISDSFGLSGMKQRNHLFGGVVRKLQGTGTKYIISNRKEHVDAYSRSR